MFNILNIFFRAVNPQWPSSDSSIELLKEHNPNVNDR